MEGIPGTEGNPIPLDKLDTIADTFSEQGEDALLVTPDPTSTELPQMIYKASSMNALSDGQLVHVGTKDGILVQVNSPLEIPPGEWQIYNEKIKALRKANEGDLVFGDSELLAEIEQEHPNIFMAFQDQIEFIEEEEGTRGNRPRSFLVDDNLQWSVNPEAIDWVCKNAHKHVKTLRGDLWEKERALYLFFEPFATAPYFRYLSPKDAERVSSILDTALTHLKREQKTFAIPSHPLMFSLLAPFAGKPSRIPRKAIEKNPEDRTPEEQAEIDRFLEGLFTDETVSPGQSTYADDEGDGGRFALICDSPKVEARALVPGSLFSEDLRYREERLALYIRRTYGAEGLRHLLGILIGMDENGRNGNLLWDVNEHLERLGFRREKSGSFKAEAKEKAREIVNSLVRFCMVLQKKTSDGKKQEEVFLKLFSIDGGSQTRDLSTWAVDNQKILMRATDQWYGKAFWPQDGEGQKYTQLLKRVAQENHREHALTIFLAPLLAVSWRVGKGKPYEAKLRTLAEWCSLEDKDGRNTSKNIKDLMSELRYMQSKGYLGEWKQAPTGAMGSKLDEQKLSLSPPDWFKDAMPFLTHNQGELEGQGPRALTDGELTREFLLSVMKKRSLSQNQMGNHLGVSHQAIGKFLNGKTKRLNADTTRRFWEAFGEDR